MDEQILARKLALINEQIEEEMRLHEALLSHEEGFRSEVDNYGDARLGVVSNWIPETLKIESQIFNRIDELQAAKTRLITGEKSPEVVYVDIEVPKIVEKEVVKFVDKEIIKYITTKETHIYKSSFSTSLLWFILFLHILIGSTIGVIYCYNLIDIVIRTNF